ncbi:SGNH hydrolase domain-containing protein [Haloglycomyces albus]|uniref:SGNH hydrolase domain-containing protein n=1 Tax=Haloglycomyces albus TaxID=526067 RepID=UPI00046D1F60|nr:SGNH hydrolase domain-containing protein [Haloglycomyces albus]
MDHLKHNDRFRTDIEGLRGVAVIGVLLFHAGVPFALGGYVGVDVFFVVSGFLITGLLIREKERHGRINLPAFYGRRARRLLPAATTVLVTTLVAAWFLLPPLRIRDIAWDAVTSALSVANWRYIDQQTDYLAGHSEPSPLLHFWSLAVEEQFYLLWAPLAAVCVLTARWRRALAVTIAVIAVVSFLLNLWWVESSGPLAYFSTPSRAWQFAVGAALALVPRFLDEQAAWLKHCLAALATAGLLTAMVWFDATTAFPGSAALLPTLAAALLIAVGPQSNRLLRLPALRWAGRVSFGWYLWHWPVLILFHAAWGPQHWAVNLLIVAVAVLPAWLTLVTVEQPIRFHQPRYHRVSAGLSVGASSMIIPVIVALLVGSGAMKVLEQQGQWTDLDPGGSGSRWEAGLPVSTDREQPLSPSPLEASQDFGTAGDCQLEPTEIEHDTCVRGDGDRIVVFGDSHASQWLPAIEAIAHERDAAVEILTKSGCPVPSMTVHNDQLDRSYTECDDWREAMFKRIESGPPPALILVASLNRYSADADEVTSAWETSLSRLTDSGAPVAYLRDTPYPGFDVPTCLSNDPSDWESCEFPRTDGLWPDPTAERIAQDVWDDVHLIDLSPTLCSADTCPSVVDNLLLYRDESHLTQAAVSRLTARLEHELATTGLVAADTAAVTTVQPGDDWRIAFRDDFDRDAGTGLSEDWIYDTGTCYPGCPAPDWGTGEIAVHTDEIDNVSHDGKGNLAITPRRDAQGRWTSGRIETARDDFGADSEGVVRLEASLRLPDVDESDGLGYWSAFWAMGADLRDGYTGWPATGEIDMMESVNGNGSVFGALHCGSLEDGPCQEETGGLGSPPQDCYSCSESFHRYAAEIDHEVGEVRWYLDGRLFHSITRDDIGPRAWSDALDQGVFLILNVAIGGQFPDAYHDGPGSTPVSDTVDGKSMLIDYVAVYTHP